MNIIAHAEKYLGKIEQGWKDIDSEVDLQVVAFKDAPGETVSTFLSIGMSDEILKLNEGKTVRQELVFSAYTLTETTTVVSFLLSLCESVLERGGALLRGEVIPLTTELAERIGFYAVYCTIPVFFPDDFATFNGSQPDTVMVWVLPIYQNEANFISENGWESFEDLLEEKDPDLCSLARESVI